MKTKERLSNLEYNFMQLLVEIKNIKTFKNKIPPIIEVKFGGDKGGAYERWKRVTWDDKEEFFKIKEWVDKKLQEHIQREWDRGELKEAERVIIRTNTNIHFHFCPHCENDNITQFNDVEAVDGKCAVYCPDCGEKVLIEENFEAKT